MTKVNISKRAVPLTPGPYFLCRVDKQPGHYLVADGVMQVGDHAGFHFNDHLGALQVGRDLLSLPTHYHKLLTLDHLSVPDMIKLIELIRNDGREEHQDYVGLDYANEQTHQVFNVAFRRVTNTSKTNFWQLAHLF